MIVNHNDREYIRWREAIGADKYNGAYYYSVELCRNVIPHIKTGRTWVTVDLPEAKPYRHVVAFVHHNTNANWYEGWRGKDAVLVCGVPETVERMTEYGKAIYLPLSIDTEYVKRFRAAKTRGVCFAGRREKITRTVPAGVDILTGLPRKELLAELARYRQVYAVGRLALEAKVLGCEVLPYDPRYPDPEAWIVRDNAEAIKPLQTALDRIDRRAKQCTI